MKRSKRTRTEKKILTNLHNSKLCFYPEQCNHKFREPLSEIDQEYSIYRQGSFRHVYKSETLDELNERMHWGLERYKGRLIWDKFQPRRNRDCESYHNYDDRTRFKQSADRRDLRGGVYDPLDFKPSKYNSNKHLTQQGLDEYYEPYLEYDYLDCDCDDGYEDFEVSLYELGCDDDQLDDIPLDYWEEVDQYRDNYEVFEELEYFEDVHIDIKQSLCPEDGRHVENEETLAPTKMPWIKRVIPMLLSPFIKSTTLG